MNEKPASHQIKLRIDRAGFADVTLDGEQIPNLTDAVVHLTRGHATVVLTLEYVEVEMEGEMGQGKVTTRIEQREYEAKS